MKSSLEQTEISLSTTSEGRKKLQIKENSHLLNHISKLAADHDVKVSNTMIKVTYKKALKDQNSVDSVVDCNTDSDLGDGKNRPIEVTNLCSSDISFIVKSPKLPTDGQKVFHSTPKPAKTNAEKNKKYVNGLNPSVKLHKLEGMSSASKIQKPPSSPENGSKKPKTAPNKLPTKPELNKTFLKGNGLVKPKTSIIQRNGGDGKKTKLGKGSDKKIKKLENGIKSKTGVDKKGTGIKGVKRKASNAEINDLVKHKKMKINDSKTKRTEASRGLEEVNKSGSKKPIMLVDPDLPTGWTRFIRTKNKGSSNEQYVVYVVNPQGKKFRFKWKLRKYLQRTNSSLDVDQFFFGLYQRPKTSNVSATERDEKSKMSAGAIPREESPDDFLNVESSPESDQEKHVIPYESSNNQKRSSDGKKILFFDPDLPFGWKRVIRSNSSSGRKQVHIISPDGKIFRRRYRLNEYLIKHQYTHSLDRFYFGLYPKKEGSSVDALCKGLEEKTPKLVKLYKTENYRKLQGSATIYNKPNVSELNLENGSDIHELTGDSKIDLPHSPMYDDPNLPDGWKRFIKIRSCGESAGRMEVVIVSPEGKKHRSRKHLEHYLMQKRLNYKAQDFDFSVFGRKRHPLTSSAEPDAEPEPEPESEPETSHNDVMLGKKKFTDKPVPELDINSLKEPVVSPEGRLINTVTGLALSSGLSTSRNERRQRLPRKEHEKELRNYLNTETEFSFDDCQIPTHWVQRLVKCRGDFRIVEPDAVATIAETTKEFLKKVSLQALVSSKKPENGLKYEDIAEVVDATEGLSFLQTLIPKKITFREYVKLNRPKQFMSFT